MTKVFTTVDGLTHVCESTRTIALAHDKVLGMPTMKLVEGDVPPIFVFGHPTDMCDEEIDHTTHE
jgi:hypothetical protein